MKWPITTCGDAMKWPITICGDAMKWPITTHGDAMKWPITTYSLWNGLSPRTVMLWNGLSPHAVMPWNGLSPHAVMLRNGLSPHAWCYEMAYDHVRWCYEMAYHHIWRCYEIAYHHTRDSFRKSSKQKKKKERSVFETRRCSYKSVWSSALFSPILRSYIHITSNQIPYHVATGQPRHLSILSAFSVLLSRPMDADQPPLYILQTEKVLLTELDLHPPSSFCPFLASASPPSADLGQSITSAVSSVTLRLFQILHRLRSQKPIVEQANLLEEQNTQKFLVEGICRRRSKNF